MAESSGNISSPVTDIEIQASQIIERLEEVAEKAVDIVGSQETDKSVNYSASDIFGLKGNSWNVNEEVLEEQAKSIPQILRVLEDLIIFENDDPDENGMPQVASLVPLPNVAKFAFVIQSVACFANTLERTHLNNLNFKIHNDTTRWITNLFRVADSEAFYHDEPLEGLVRITRMLLHYRYPKYLELGFECLGVNPPVLYSTFASLGVAQHLCHQLGLALTCIHPIAFENNIESPLKLDINYLQKGIQEDRAANKIPLLLLADAGSPITGYVDNIVKLKELCEQQNVWLHVKGHNLAGLALINSSLPSRVADSMTLPIGTWLGTPGLPTITLYKKIKSDNGQVTGAGEGNTLPLIAGLVADLQKCLTPLPLWFTLQVLGKQTIQTRIKKSFLMSEILWNKLTKYNCLKLLSNKPGGESDSMKYEDLLLKPVTNSASIFERTASTVVFQFIPESQRCEVSHVSKIPSYFNKLNSWLGQILQRDVPQVNVEICELEYAGLVLRICPLEALVPINEEDIDLFINCLEQQLDILSATVRLKSVFQKLVEKDLYLQFVEIEGWAGLGGVRYLPQYVENVESVTKQDVNKLNIEIVNKLRTSDAAFSLGMDGDGLVCIRFGMVTEDTDIEELLSLVTSIGKNVEESSKYLETMVEIVKKGIETATMDLQKENEERLWQEGILRHVPVFGSIVNWWSPKAKESGIKGRSLNLQAGVVESTENIYRYHMQLQQGASSPGAKSPPQPLVQTSILVTDSSSWHSRSSSHSSQLSQKSIEPKSNLPLSDNPIIEN